MLMSCILVSGSVDKLIKIWDLRAEGACHTLAGHEYTVYHLAFDDYKIGKCHLLSFSPMTHEQNSECQQRPDNDNVGLHD